MHPVKGAALCPVVLYLGKHERVLLTFSVLLMALSFFPSSTQVVQGVLLGMLLLASRLPAGDSSPGFPSRLLPRVDLLDKVERWVS